MTTDEKAAAFDTLARAMTGQWSNGRWRWLCPTPCGGPQWDTEAEAVADLVAWAQRIARRRGKPTLMQLEIQKESESVQP